MVSSTPRPYFTPGKDPVPIVQEAGCVPGPVSTGGKSRPMGIRSPDRPVRSSAAIPTDLPGPRVIQDVTGGTYQTSGECSLGHTIPI